MIPHLTGERGKAKKPQSYSQQAVPPYRGEGAQRDPGEGETQGHDYRNMGEEGAGKGKERAAGWPGEGGEGGGLPFDPRAPKMLSGQTLPENPSWIPPHSSLCSAGFTALRCSRTLFMAAPFSSPCLQAPKASGQAKGGWWGQGSPPQLPNPFFEPCWTPEGGWAQRGPSRLLTECPGGRDRPPGMAPHNDHEFHAASPCCVTVGRGLNWM